MLADWVAQHATVLSVISYVLAGFSLIFGGKVLGRFPALKDRGGVYRALLFGIPMGCFVAAMYYGENVITHDFYTATIRETLNLSIDGVTFGAIMGARNGLVGTLLYPNSFRRSVVRRFQGLREAPETESSGLGASALDITRYVYWVIGNFIFLMLSQAFLLVFLADRGWSRPSVDMATDIALLAAVSLVGSAPAFLGKPVHAMMMSLRRWIQSRRFVVFRYASLVVGLSVTALTLLLTAIGFSVFYVPAIILLVIPVYLGLSFGWLVVAFLVVASLLSSALVGLNLAIDHLSTRALSLIFAAPGAAAAVIGFFASFPMLLRILPF